MSKDLSKTAAEVFLGKLYASLNGKIGNTAVSVAGVKVFADELDAYNEILGGEGLGIIRVDPNGPGTLELQGTISQAVAGLEIWDILYLKIALSGRGVHLVQVRKDPGQSFLVSVLAWAGEDGYY